MKAESDLAVIFRDDGVAELDLTTFANRPVSSLRAVREVMGRTGSWAVRLVCNDRFGGVLIQQQPGQSNRLHYHPDSDECWVIMEGTMVWEMEGVRETTVTKVTKGDIVLVRMGDRHLIRCVGASPAVRFAITRPDVTHVYAEGEGGPV